MPKWLAPGLIALFAVAYIAPLGIRPLFQPDEFRYAEIPREMLAGGDWVVPRLDGMRYFEKPVLGYWLTAASMSAFGRNNFALRLPTALSAGLAALAVFLLVRRFSGGVAQAGAAVGVLLTGSMFYMLGCYNTLDMPLTMFLTAAAALFFFAYQADDPRRKAWYLALFGAAVGCAFLTKGFLALAVPCATIVPFMLWERRTGKVFRLAWIPLLTMLLVALPWCLTIWRREPDFWPQFFWEQHVRRFFSYGAKAQHSEPVWFFIPWIAGGLLPWTVFFPAAAIGLGKEKLKDPLVRFAICWLLFPFLFYSMSKGKLPTYILPCLPPLAVLAGLGLPRYFEGGRHKAFVVGAWAIILLLDAALLAIILLGVTGGAVLSGPLAQARQFLYRPDEQWKWLLLISSLVAWAALWFSAVQPRTAWPRLALLCAGPCLFLLASNFAAPQAVLDRCAPEAFLARDSARVEPDAPLFARAGLAHAVAWHYRRTDVLLFDSTGEFDYGLSCPEGANREVELDVFPAFVAKYPPATVVTVIMERDYYNEVKARLPKAEFEDMNDGFVFAQYRGGLPPRHQGTKNDGTQNY